MDWISVDERMPEDNVMVLIVYLGTAGEPIVTAGRYCPTDDPDNIPNWRGDVGARDSFWKVTHWMPLPDPPEEAKHD